MAVNCQTFGCADCPFRTVGSRHVGTAGPVDATLVVVGEAPGDQELSRGVPFIGPSGRMLRQGLHAAGVNPETTPTILANALACHYPASAKPAQRAAAIVACADRLGDDLAEQPRRVIIAAGNMALHALSGNPKLKITKVRGVAFEWGWRSNPADPDGPKVLPPGWDRPALVVPTVHPAAVLRSPNEWRKFVADLAYAGQLHRGEIEPRTPGETQWRTWIAPEATPEYQRLPAHGFLGTQARRKLAGDFDRTLAALVDELLAQPVLAADIETEGFSPLNDRTISIGIAHRKNRVEIFDQTLLYELDQYGRPTDVPAPHRQLVRLFAAGNLSPSLQTGPLPLGGDATRQPMSAAQRRDHRVRALINRFFPTLPTVDRAVLGQPGTPAWVWHNGKFDTKFLIQLGLPARCDHDTMLMHYCLSPQTKVLKRDLTWTTAGELQAGEELVGFDEQATSHYRPTTVLATKRQMARTYRITTASGRTIECSENHSWLVSRRGNNSKVWRTTGDLAASTRGHFSLSQFCEPWETDTTRDGGWLAGIFDGEGWLSAPIINKFGQRSGHQLAFAQNSGIVLDRAMAELHMRGFAFNNAANATNNVHRVVLSGYRGALRAIGMLRPTRFMARSDELWVGFRRSRPDAITSIEYLGEREVIGIETDSSTLIAEGYQSHNCLVEAKGGHDLKTLSSELLGAPDYEDAIKDALADLKRRHKRAKLPPPNYGDLPRPLLYRYQALDCDFTLQLFQHLGASLFQSPGLTQLYTDILMGASRFLAQVESRGIYIDRQKLDDLTADLGSRVAGAEAEVWAQADLLWDAEKYQQQTGAKKLPVSKKGADPDTRGFNSNSWQHLNWIIYKQLRLSPPASVRGLKANTSKATLDAINKHTPHPFINALLTYRTLAKLHSTYALGIMNKLDADGRLRATFLIHGTECVTGDTRIWTDRGMVRAAELADHAPGFAPRALGILADDGPRATSHTYVGAVREVLRLDLGLGLTLRCTPEHPLLTLRGWVPAADLRPDDFVRTAHGANFFPASDPAGWSPALAELAGMFLADGHMQWSEAAGHYGVVFSNRDPLVQERIRALVAEAWPIARVVDNGADGVVVRGKAIVAAWRELFPRNGAANKRTPEAAWRLSRASALAFVRGCALDSTWGDFAEGSGRPARSLVRFASLDRERLALVQAALLNCGVRAGLHFHAGNVGARRRVAAYDAGAADATVSGVQGYWQLHLRGAQARAYAALIGGVTTRQIDQAAQWATVAPSARGEGVKGYRLHNGQLYVQFRRATAGGRERVYDLTVPERHAFTAAGLVVHNTGRLSSNNPNVQNIPRNKEFNIKAVFSAAPGRVLIEVDYAAQELRMLALMSGDPFFVELFKRPGADPHMEMARAIFDTPPGEKPTDEQRTAAKSVNFGIAYGRTKHGLVNDPNLAFTDELADTTISQWKRNAKVAWATLASWRAVPERVLATGKPGLLMTPYGRRRRFVHVSQDNLNAMQNEASNFPIQSASSDVTMTSAIALETPLAQFGAFVVNIIHDAILIDAPDDHDTIKAILRLCFAVMRDTPRKVLGDLVLFDADAKVGRWWGKMDKWDVDGPVVERPKDAAAALVASVEAASAGLDDDDATPEWLDPDYWLDDDEAGGELADDDDSPPWDEAAD